jgi:predicted dehydrogenase
MYKKILFIGLGGAGQRHLRIFRELFPNAKFSAYRHTSKTPLLSSNFSVDSSNTIQDKYKLEIYADITKAFEDEPDLTVISTPTSSHIEPMMLAVKNGSSVFVEKPWSDSLKDFMNFKSQIINNGLEFHISFQRRFHPMIARTQKSLSQNDIGNIMAASFTVYSNVPCWHSYEDWKELYAVRSDLGGGVLLTEIHEIDMICWFFGRPSAVFCSGGNRSSQTLPIEDTVQMTLLFGNFSVQVTLCFMHENTKRNFHIVGSYGEISWDEQDNVLIINKHNDKPKEFSDSGYLNDDMFIEQAKQFTKNWSKEKTLASLDSASDSLAIVEAAKKSIYSKEKEIINYINYVK